MNTRFSIIIPVYNVAPYLRECLDSVLAQTFTDWEAICVDDGSTDGSGAILDEYVATDGRFRVIHQKNAGVSAARNAALDVAKGEWVCFVDADDVIDRDWLRAMMLGTGEPECDWIKMWFVKWQDGSVRPQIMRSVEDLSPQFYVGLMDKWRISANGAMTVLNVYRRSCIGEGRFDLELRVWEDAVFLLSILPKVRKVCYLMYDGYYYRIRSESASNREYTVEDVRKYLDRKVKLALAHDEINAEDQSASVLIRPYFTERLWRDAKVWAAGWKSLPPLRERRALIALLKIMVEKGWVRPNSAGSLLAVVKWWMFVHTANPNWIVYAKRAFRQTFGIGR